MKIFLSIVLTCVLLSSVRADNNLTYQDSVELGFIDNGVQELEKRNYVEHIRELKREIRQLNQSLAKAESNEGQDYTWLYWIVGVFVVIDTGLIIYFLRRKRQREGKVKEFKSLADRAQETLRQREKFLAYTNHEIRTPLNAVSGSAELLASTNLTQNQEKYVKTIQASVDNVLILVNEVLDLSRIESGNIEFERKDFMLSDIMEGVSYILSEKVDKKGLQFNVHCDSKIPPIIKGDSRYLRQILINLCNNAVKFTDLGSVSLNASLLESNEKSMRIRFDIVDTGKGIRKSKIATIFNQFEQETRHTIKHKGGSGLGLAITKQLVELQGGSITVDSMYLEGTTFSVELDFFPSKSQFIAKDKVDTSLLDNLKIMVVDDNQLNREILSDVLNNLNDSCEVVALSGGELAIEKLSETDFDLILLDIQMPGMDGYETSKYIRSNMRRPMNEIPIIAMTAYAMDDVAEKCFSSGMNDFITKPLDSKFLITKIDRLISKKKNAQKVNVSFNHVDLGNLKRISGGDTNKMYKYIDLFLENLPKDIEEYQNLLDKEDFSSAMKILHKIKGNVVYMGNMEIPDIYDDLENVDLDKSFLPQLTYVVEVANNCVDEIKKIKANYKLLFLGIDK